MAAPETLAEELSLEEQIGQCFMAGFHGETPPDGILDLIQRQRVGGVILFSRNCRHPAQIATLTAALQAAARAAGHPAPLMIATDQENGLVQRLGDGVTPFPGNMALGATSSAELTEAVAEATGAELRALGITMNLAPDADVNNNAANPVIGVRSFGADPHEVARLVVAAVRGYQRAGVVGVDKHFPGHGDTASDSHLLLPVIPHDRARLEALELVPFSAAIAAGAEAMMTAHVAVPRLTGETATPASLAPEISGVLLHDTLGFDGVTITDCLEMHAIARTVGVARGAVAALAAGNDLVLVSHTAGEQRAAVAAVRAAVIAGELPRQRVAQAAARVLRLKRLRPASNVPAPDDVAGMVGTTAHRELSARAYARATTLIRDEARLVPLRLAADERILVVAQHSDALSKAVDMPYHPEAFADELGRHHPHVAQIVLSAHPSPSEQAAAERAAAAADVLVLLTLNAHLNPGHARCMRRLASLVRRVAAIATANPYDATAQPELRTYLATYEYTPAALRAAARVLAGDLAPSGRLPVPLAL
ncbi:MAG: glycoside hydrolase family 3 protein [Ktedonobacterales bacterium]